MNITDKFIELIYDISNRNFSDEIIKEVKLSLLDYLGVTYAGEYINREKNKRYLSIVKSDLEESRIIGSDQKVGLYDSILLNGINSHVLELDDGERRGMLHPGTPVISSLISFALAKRINVTQLIKGIIVGYEVAIRFARTLQPVINDKGYHGTGVCGSLGSALAVAVCLNQNREEMKHSLSAATTTSSGVLAVINNQSELKPYNVGHAALNGTISAFMSASGYLGPIDVLGGEKGFLPMMNENFNSNILLEDSDYCLKSIYRKPYAACRHSHGAIEASLKIKTENNINYLEIKKIEIKTHKWAVDLHDHKHIENVNSAKMSTPYSVAVALITGKASLEEFSNDLINDINIVNIIQKIDIISDDYLTSLVPFQRATIVAITTNSGNIYHETVSYPKGEPENRLTSEDIKLKFRQLLLFSNANEEKTEKIINYVLDIENKYEQIIELL